jgi:hypothetical protein
MEKERIRPTKRQRLNQLWTIALVIMAVLATCSIAAKYLVLDKWKEDNYISNRYYCETDSDCVCGGIDTATGRCFLGNKYYYESFVDVSKFCPDFCTGIAGHLETKCVENRCTQVNTLNQ